MTRSRGGTSTHRTEHSYYTNGDLHITTDPRGKSTTLTYDPYGNVETVTDPRNGKTESVYDSRSRLTERTDAEGRTTKFEYDTLDRLTSTTRPQVPEGIPVDRVTYFDVERTQWSVDAESRGTLSGFDREGRIIWVDNAEGGTKRFDYDLAGNKILESSWFDNDTPRLDTEFTYDDAGRLEYRIEPLGRQTHYEYDAVGNLVAETLEDTQGGLFDDRRVEHDYDELNRTIRTRRFLGNRPITEEAVLDGEGNAVLLRDALGRETNQRFDALNRRIEVLEPLWRPGRRRTTEFAYDGNGNLIRQTLLNEDLADQANDQVTEFEYDELNRLESQEVILSTDISEETTFGYDKVGNLEFQIDPRLHKVSYSYDALNRRRTTEQNLTPLSDLGWVVTGMSYDLVGNKVEELHPNGNVVTHRYDDLNRLEESSDSLGTLGSVDLRCSRQPAHRHRRQRQPHRQPLRRSRPPL